MLEERRMRMQKEEKIVVVLLLMALGSLTVASWMFGEQRPEDEKPSRLSVEGLVLEIKPTKTGGNLLIRLDSTSLPVFVPRDSGAGEVQRRVHPGDRVRIAGEVSEFEGNAEIKVRHSRDIEAAA